MVCLGNQESQDIWPTALNSSPWDSTKSVYPQSVYPLWQTMTDKFGPVDEFGHIWCNFWYRPLNSAPAETSVSMATIQKRRQDRTTVTEPMRRTCFSVGTNITSTWTKQIIPSYAWHGSGTRAGSHDTTPANHRARPLSIHRHWMMVMLARLPTCLPRPVFRMDPISQR